MPLYEYQCGQCDKRFELLQKFEAPPQAPCPDCGATAERQLSVPAIQFKGSGWYVTDYARKPAPAEKGEAKADGTSAGKTEPGKESKKDSPAKSPASKKSD